MANKYRKRRYTITCKCGHEMEVNIGGYTEEYRQEVLEDYKNHVCYKCEAKAREEELKESMPNIELTPLQGTEKQIAWAEDIRNKMLDKCKDNAEIMQIILTETSAKYFIENRNKEAKDIAVEILEKDLVIPEEIDETEFVEIEDEEAKEIRKNLVIKLEEIGYRLYNEDEVYNAILYLTRRIKNTILISEFEAYKMDSLIENLNNRAKRYKKRHADREDSKIFR